MDFSGDRTPIRGRRGLMSQVSFKRRSDADLDRLEEKGREMVVVREGREPTGASRIVKVAPSRARRRDARRAGGGGSSGQARG
jgi:hypothetical protein